MPALSGAAYCPDLLGHYSTCRRLVVKTADGVSHEALLTFTR